MLARLLAHLRGQWMGALALFLVLTGGVAYATHEVILSSDIVDGEVKAPDIAQGAVATSEIANNEVRSVDVRDDTLSDGGLTSADLKAGAVGGAEIATGAVNSSRVADNSLFGFDIFNNSVTSADLQDNSATGTDLQDNSVTGADIQESTLSVANMGCQSGNVLGFARIKGEVAIPSTYSSDPAFIDFAHNCSGGAVQVRKPLNAFGDPVTGLYFVRFVNNPAALAVVSSNTDGQPIGSNGNDNVVSVAKGAPSDPTSFRVEVRDVNVDGPAGTNPTNGAFTIMLP